MVWNWLRRHPNLVDGAIVLVVLTAQLGDAFTSSRRGPGLVFALMQALPLAVRRQVDEPIAAPKGVNHCPCAICLQTSQIPTGQRRGQQGHYCLRAPRPSEQPRTRPRPPSAPATGSRDLQAGAAALIQSAKAMPPRWGSTWRVCEGGRVDLMSPKDPAVQRAIDQACQPNIRLASDPAPPIASIHGRV